MIGGNEVAEEKLINFRRERVDGGAVKNLMRQNGSLSRADINDKYWFDINVTFGEKATAYAEGRSGPRLPLRPPFRTVRPASGISPTAPICESVDCL